MSKEELLGIDIHVHTNLDPKHCPGSKMVISYDYRQAIDQAKSKGISVLSFTHHNKLIYTPEMAEYAKSRGVLLIPGFEATIEQAHVIILNPSTDNITTFRQLAHEKRTNKNAFIFAVHPYYPAKWALRKKLKQYIHLFDGIEYCHFYLKFFNTFNKKAKMMAMKYKLPFIGTSDAHYLDVIGATYTLIRCKKTVQSVIENLKAGNVSIVTRPISLPQVISSITDFSTMKKIKKIIPRAKIVA